MVVYVRDRQKDRLRERGSLKRWKRRIGVHERQREVEKVRLRERERERKKEINKERKNE